MDVLGHGFPIALPFDTNATDPVILNFGPFVVGSFARALEIYCRDTQSDPDELTVAVSMHASIVANGNAFLGGDRVFGSGSQNPQINFPGGGLKSGTGATGGIRLRVPINRVIETGRQFLVVRLGVGGANGQSGVVCLDAPPIVNGVVYS